MSFRHAVETLIARSAVTLLSKVADGASAVAAAVDTTAALSNAAARLLSIRTNGSEKLGVLASGAITSPGDVSFAMSGTTVRARLSDLGGVYALYLGSDYFYAGAGQFIFRPNGQQTFSVSGAGTQFNDTGGTEKFSVDAAGIPKWTNSSNVQTTVGVAGGASALPATPSKYLLVKDSAGTTYVLPAYLP